MKMFLLLLPTLMIIILGNAASHERSSLSPEIAVLDSVLKSLHTASRTSGRSMQLLPEDIEEDNVPRSNPTDDFLFPEEELSTGNASYPFSSVWRKLTKRYSPPCPGTSCPQQPCPGPPCPPLVYPPPPPVYPPPQPVYPPSRPVYPPPSPVYPPSCPGLIYPPIPSCPPISPGCPNPLLNLRSVLYQAEYCQPRCQPKCQRRRKEHCAIDHETLMTRLLFLEQKLKVLSQIESRLKIHAALLLRVQRDPKFPGQAGPRGPPGPKGYQGPPGPVGQSGNRGSCIMNTVRNPPSGYPGPPGRKGSPGLAGDRASCGCNGERGEQGPPGENKRGSSGPRGFKGEKGTKGPDAVGRTQ